MVGCSYGCCITSITLPGRFVPDRTSLALCFTPYGYEYCCNSVLSCLYTFYIDFKALAAHFADCHTFCCHFLGCWHFNAGASQSGQLALCVHCVRKYDILAFVILILRCFYLCYVSTITLPDRFVPDRTSLTLSFTPYGYEYCCNSISFYSRYNYIKTIAGDITCNYTIHTNLRFISEKIVNTIYNSICFFILVIYIC